jgi:hypothetical protein
VNDAKGVGEVEKRDVQWLTVSIGFINGASQTTTLPKAFYRWQDKARFVTFHRSVLQGKLSNISKQLYKPMSLWFEGSVAGLRGFGVAIRCISLQSIGIFLCASHA